MLNAASAIFYDCRVQSARLVLANIIDAVDRGAFAVNYLKAEEWIPKGQGWQITVRDTLSHEIFNIEARKLIDATGAWSEDASLRLVRGSHIIIPRVNASDNAISYFERSGRIVFLIPWGSENQLTLVGTTDIDHSTGPDRVQITPDETEYLLGIVQQVFPEKGKREVISSYSSLRPLVPNRSNSPTSASREHRIWNSEDGILHIAGGKYTTYRAMSEEAADLACHEIAPELDKNHWTEKITLREPDAAARNGVRATPCGPPFRMHVPGLREKMGCGSVTAFCGKHGGEAGLG
jgi:glycerol-3-phosphate dehydrogenase